MYTALYNYVTCYTHVETRLRKPTTLLAGSKRIPARSSNTRSEGSDLSGSVRNQPSCVRRRHCGKFQSYSSLPRINAPNAATLQATVPARPCTEAQLSLLDASLHQQGHLPGRGGRCAFRHEGCRPRRLRSSAKRGSGARRAGGRALRPQKMD